jgi:hypothetical protein
MASRTSLSGRFERPDARGVELDADLAVVARPRVDLRDAGEAREAVADLLLDQLVVSSTGSSRLEMPSSTTGKLLTSNLRTVGRR